MSEMAYEADEVQNFFNFINERHRIYLKKSAGEPWPWTDDPILQEWKFCNVFRRLDRTSAWLIDNVILPHDTDEPSLILFNIFVFRAFNLVDTYEYIGGWQTSWSARAVESKLLTKALKQKPIISGAYMIRGYKGQPKSQSIPETLEKIWSSKRTLLADIKRGGHSLENAYNAILGHGYWGWGPFTTYQIVLDLSYSPILEFPGDINSWCAFGPGAIRGLHILNPYIGKKDFIAASKDLLILAPHYVQPHVPELTLQDIEFSLCEFQKYTRIKLGGRSKQRYEHV